MQKGEPVVEEPKSLENEQAADVEHSIASLLLQIRQTGDDMTSASLVKTLFSLGVAMGSEITKHRQCRKKYALIHKQYEQAKRDNAKLMQQIKELKAALDELDEQLSQGSSHKEKEKSIHVKRRS